MRLGIVVSEFNYDITRLMLEKALDHAKFLGVEEVLVLKVPGSFEAPLAAKRLLEEGCDAVAVLGAVIKGETDHDQVVAHQVARKLMDLSLEYGKPVTLGVIGPGPRGSKRPRG